MAGQIGYLPASEAFLTMKRLSRIILPLLICLTACGPTKPPARPTQPGEDPPPNFKVVPGEAGPDDIGHFLAGLPVRYGSGLSQLQQTPEYQEHQREMHNLWRIAERAHVSLMHAWTTTELTPIIGGGGTVLYPFGGPDLLYVRAMFPQARTYALMGLEPVGDVPALESMDATELFSALAAFRQATRTQLAAGYFITKDMKSELEHKSLRGVMPILLSTVALIGGEVESASLTTAGGNPAIDLRFRDAGGGRHNAYYVSGDLSNSGFKGAYRQWLASLGGKITYFKAASYLMTDNSFSQAREFFLSQSHYILQDDSGIPFRYFGQGWSFRYFGNYEHPIEFFAKYQQEDLRQAYANNPHSPINFGSGYHMNQEGANLLLAIKR